MRAKTLACLVILSVTPQFSPCGLALIPSKPQAAALPDAQALPLGQTLQKEIVQGQRHEYSIAVERGAFASVAVEQMGADVAVWVVDPNSAKVFEIDSLNGAFGQEPAGWVAATEGTYRVVVESATEGSHRYTIQLCTIRAATAADRAWADSLKSVATATTLILTKKFDQALEHALSAASIVEREMGPDAPELVLPLETLGRVYTGTGAYDRAVETLARAEAICEKAFGPDTPHLASVLEARGLVYRAVARHQESIPAFARRLEILDDAYGPDDPGLQSTIEFLASAYVNTQQFDRAETLYVRALALLEKTFGPDHARVAQVAQSLADTCSKQHQFDKAEQLLLRSLAIREKSFGPNHIVVAYSLNALGKLHNDLGQPAKAEPYLLRALAIREAALGPENEYVAQTCDYLASAYTAQSKFTEAEALFLRALAIREKTDRPDRVEVGMVLKNLALNEIEAGQYSKAEQHLTQALAIVEKALPPEHPFYATILISLGVSYYYRADFARAVPLFERGLELREKFSGHESAETAIALQNLAAAYRELGQYQRARPLMQKALRIEEAIFGPDNVDVGRILSNIGYLQIQIKDFKGAEASFLRMIAIFEKQLGPEAPLLTLGLQNLGDTYRRMEMFDKSERLLRRVLAINEKEGRNATLFGAMAIHNLGVLYKERGQYARAEQMFSRAMSLLEPIVGSDQSRTAAITIQIAFTRAAAGNVDGAVNALIQASQVREKTFLQNLSLGSERGKIEFLETYARELDATISIQSRMAPNNPAALHLAIETLLRRKGRALDAMADAIQDLRRSSDPEDTRLLNELMDLRAQIASLSIKGSVDDRESPLPEQIQTLSEQSDALESAVSRRSTRFRNASAPITLEAVQSAVPTDAALVEFALFRTFNPRAVEQKCFGEPRYAAYVVRQHTAPQFVDLGRASVVDAAVETLRKALSDPTRNDVKALARKLDRLVMAPVRKRAGSPKHLLISPDGALNLVPFGALVDETGRYLIETYAISYLTSGRDLLRLSSASEAKSQPAIVADPDFGDAHGDAHGDAIAATRDIVQIGAREFTPLTGTSEEARDLAALLPEACVYTRNLATETAIKQFASPRILHIATHGFFVAPTQASDLENPLLRSGLALAGANTFSTEPDDGVLTALEVAGLDLGGTDLVVLSACNTGVGDIGTSEGVYGLRRALVLAGSKNQMMSLWSVSDSATRDLMIAFYKHLLAGEDCAAALQHVQLRMIGDPKTSHPFYWAGFIESGAGTNLK